MYSGTLLSGLMETVERAELARTLDLGTCQDVCYEGTALQDYRDAVGCWRDAEIAIISGQNRGLTVCGRCYEKRQKRGEL